MKGTAERKAAARSHEHFRIPSYLQLLRGRLDPGTAGHCVHSSHSSFSRRSFFERSLRRRSAVIDRRYRAGSNEVETGKYSGFWLPRHAFARRILFPAFTASSGTQAFCLCGERTSCPQFLNRFTNLLAAQTQNLCSAATNWPWEIVSSHSSATAPEFHRNSLRRSTTVLTKNCPQK
jgi:hypothetical protein